MMGNNPFFDWQFYNFMRYPFTFYQTTRLGLDQNDSIRRRRLKVSRTKIFLYDRLETIAEKEGNVVYHVLRRKFTS